MNTSTPEEVWLARIAYVFGAKELIDAVLNVITLAKTHADLGLVAQSAASNDYVTVAYLATSALAGIYLLAGGSLFSRLAYGRCISRDELLGETPLPDGAGWLALGIRALAIHQFIKGISDLALAISFNDFAPIASEVRQPRMSVVWTVLALERFVIAFLLLSYGGRLAAFFAGVKRTVVKPSDSISGQ